MGSSGIFHHLPWGGEGRGSSIRVKKHMEGMVLFESSQETDGRTLIIFLLIEYNRILLNIPESYIWSWNQNNKYDS